MAHETKKNGPRKIAGQHESRGIHHECKPPDQAAFGPEHGASGNREQQELGVLLPMIDRQHGKSRDCRERKPELSGRGAGSQGDEHPYEQERRTYKISWLDCRCAGRPRRR